MKRIISIILLIICIISFSSCSMFIYDFFAEENPLPDEFNIDKSDFNVIEEEDTHGGFLGDGWYYLILDCSDNKEKARGITKDWQQLPLSENLNIMMYGGEKDGVSYGYDFAKTAHWPDFENAVYKFVDRYTSPAQKNKFSDAELLDRYSVNFSVAVYDLDTDRLYYFEYDT